MIHKTDNPENFSRAGFLKRVESIIQERIRPSLHAHGGDMYVRDADEKTGEIWVVFTGACKTCPAAQMTLESTVETVFREELKNAFGRVRLVNETDDDLLNFARQLLNKNKK